jgi:hypothetical protein
MQLVAYGAQDIYLTGNPMITYFKVVYRRHTNFAMESIQQTFNGSVGWGNRVTALISRNGDLVSGMTLEVTLPNIATTAVGAGVTRNARWVNDVGHHIMSQVEVEIGGQLIDRHYSDWLEIWAQLTVPASKKLGYRQMIGQDPLSAGGTVVVPTVNTDANAANGASLQGGVQSTNTVAILTGRKIFVPLQFWFCRNVGLALPLIALQYHEVKVNITFEAADALALSLTTTNAGATNVNTTNITVSALTDATLWVDYIYLDTDERRRFAQVSHEYLIEQLQMNVDTYTAGQTNKSVNLTFNHPVKELVWVFIEDLRRIYGTGAASDENKAVIQNPSHYTWGTDEMTGRDNFAAQSSAGNNPLLNAKLQLNGQDRFAERVGAYFSRVQPYQCHTCIPDSPGINVYSFALKPEEHQPSGTCNFSRIDNAKLIVSLRAAAGNGATAAAATPGTTGGSITVFATNYNVLRVMSGMGGLAYSN